MQEDSLMTRLKVRQWTQMLVDHSLLLGSSSEGIHLHDIVLQYLRKRLSEEEMRTEQTKVVEGIIAASEARVASMGRGLQDTGATVAAFAGEEVDWYCCNVGPYHVRRARDPSVGVADDESIQRWVLGSDPVLVRAVATAVGAEGLTTLVAHFLQREHWLRAAKVEWASYAAAGWYTEDGRARVKAALALIEEGKLSLGPPRPRAHLVGKATFEKSILSEKILLRGLGTYFTRIGLKFRTRACNRFVNWSHMSREMTVVAFVTNMGI